VLFQQIAEAPNELRTVGGRDTRPRTAFERLPRGRHRKVDVCFVARRDVGDNLLRRRVFDLEGLAALGLDPLAVDQRAMELARHSVALMAGV
jgi:hypothetical protein